MSAGSFRGDAADSENNGARGLLRLDADRPMCVESGFVWGSQRMTTDRLKVDRTKIDHRADDHRRILNRHPLRERN